MADHIHLNPVRAGLAGGEKGKLAGYKLSSFRSYAKRKAPVWLVFDRVLKAFELTKEDRGRRSYVNYLEKRAESRSGDLGEEAMAALRRGWYLGNTDFRDQLLDLAQRAKSRVGKRGSHSPEVARGCDELEALRILESGRAVLELPKKKSALGILRKSDPRKVALAILLRKKTSVSNSWIAERLRTGHPDAVSRLTKAGKQSKECRKLVKAVEKMLSHRD